MQQSRQSSPIKLDFLFTRISTWIKQTELHKLTDVRSGVKLDYTYGKCHFNDSNKSSVTTIYNFMGIPGSQFGSLKHSSIKLANVLYREARPAFVPR